MERRAHLYLIPGFFGFSDIGGIRYFHHVEDFLRETLESVGIQASIHVVVTRPTASIRDRAARLLETIASTASHDEDPIHLIGHSTGGLDARLFVTPRVSLSGALDPEPFASRVVSVTSVATPHYGTPLASWFGSLTGKKALEVLSLATFYLLRFGHLPLQVLFRLIGVVARFDGLFGLRNNILDQVHSELLADFDVPRQEAISLLLREVHGDQSLLRQLTPEGIDLFNAATSSRDGVHYGSVVTMGPRPSLGSLVRTGVDPYAQASHGLYRALHLLTSRWRNPPRLSPGQLDTLTAALGCVPDARDNDGMVPTLSQVYGEIIHAAVADHLDVCGHYDDPDTRPPHVDWVVSGAGTTTPRFQALWHDVATFIVESSKDAVPEPPPEPRKTRRRKS